MFTFSFVFSSNQAMTKTDHWCLCHVVCMGNLRGAFSQENTPEVHTETHKSSFFPYKQVSGRNGDHNDLE